MTIRDATYELLRQLGLTTCFGNPGSTEEPFLQNFPADFTYVLALQEASVVAMADGYAQATGHPALVNVHTGAGTGNAMGSILTAHYNKTPLIVTAGQQTRAMVLLEPLLTNVEASLLPRPAVKWSYEPLRAEDVPGAFMRAYATASQPPQGPVYLSLPLDDWSQPALGLAAVRSVSTRVAPDPVRLADFARRLQAAKSPVLVLGAALDRAGAWEPARQLAEKLQVPVWAPPSSERVAFAEDHPLYQGALPPAIGPLSEKLQGHDLVLVIGAPVFRYYPYVPGDYLPAGCQLLHLTDDPAEAARAPVGESVLGDTGMAVEALLALLVQPSSYPPAPARVAPSPTPSPTAGQPLTAAQVYTVLSTYRPADAVLVQESPSNIAEFKQALPASKPASYFTFASGGLGWALPAAVGLALGERHTGRNRPVIVVIGDGAFQYSVQCLWTAVQHKLPIVCLVLANSEYAILKSFAELEKTPGVPGLNIPGIDSITLAKGYGCQAQHADTADDLARALQTALANSGPTVIQTTIAAGFKPLL